MVGKTQSYTRLLEDLFWEILGSFLIAVSIYNFARFAEFPMSGFSGIALILRHLFGTPVGTVTILLNIPVAALCFRLIGKSFMLRSLRCMVISSLMVDYVAPLLPGYTGDKLLAAVATGALSGIGYAVIYMRNSSTGGADFLIMSAKKLRPHLKLGTITFLADMVVILAAAILFADLDGLIYGVIINVLLAVVIDKVMYGLNSGKVAWIVTEHGEAICDAIGKYCSRGSTILEGRGGYHKSGKQVVMVACSKKQMYQVENVVKSVDENVFIIIMEANEVHGEGFRVVG